METIIDFTENGIKEGDKIEGILKVFEKISSETL